MITGGEPENTFFRSWAYHLVLAHTIGPMLLCQNNDGRFDSGVDSTIAQTIEIINFSLLEPDQQTELYHK